MDGGSSWQFMMKLQEEAEGSNETVGCSKPTGSSWQSMMKLRERGSSGQAGQFQRQKLSASGEENLAVPAPGSS